MKKSKTDNNKSLISLIIILIIAFLPYTINSKIKVGYYIYSIIKNNPINQLILIYLLFFISFDLICDKYNKNILLHRPEFKMR